jgi:hypothetical protein
VRGCTATLIRAAVLAVFVAAASGCAGSVETGSGMTTRGATAATASADPYQASLAFAGCMRAHGVPHPNPDASGDFRLTPKQETRMRAVPRSQRVAAEKACFQTLKGLDMRPLTPRAKQRATKVLQQLRTCLKGHGFELGPPIVRNMSRGRALFGFRNLRPAKPSPRLRTTQRTCEKRVNLAGKLDEIIAEDRSGL